MKCCAAIALAAVVLGAVGPSAAQAPGEPAVTMWHSYRGAEEEALRTLGDRWNRAHPDTRLEILAFSHQVYADKLSKGIPLGNGPDLFVFAHERIGEWATAGLLSAVDGEAAATLADYLPETVPPLRFEGAVYGLPLAFKSLALFVNRELVEEPPRSTDELLRLADQLKARDIVPLATQASSFYFHAPWYFGYQGELFRPDGSVGYSSPGGVASFAFAAELQRRGVIPEEVTGALVAQLFNGKAGEPRAAMAINGPWFLGELAEHVRFTVHPLPIVSATGTPAKPFLTVEAAFVSAKAKDPGAAWQVARYLAGRESALERGVHGRQAVAHRAAWEDPRLATDPVLAAFKAQLPDTMAMDNRPAMRRVWEPGDLALRKVLRGDGTAADAAAAADRRHRAISRPAPAEASPTAYLILAAGGLLALLAFVLRWLLSVRRRGDGRAARRGFRWIAPAMIATGVLVVLPFVVGLVMAFFSHEDGQWTFVGLGNFGEILGAGAFDVFEPLSFYYALLVTILWTAVNLALHVGIGLGLALLLNRPLMRLRPFYRVVLILPWAVPNYITALIWKGMFHRQYGAINGLLEGLGLDGVAWFSDAGTAFFANVCTNAWLGFPFMMVICLGALQSIPKDLYQAASVDGANAWQRFRHVTLPLLRPALTPAILLGIVWTFNQFNIIYLVSQGEPDNSTDILISEAFRWAFERGNQFGYAAAYAALIFVVLLFWSLFSVRAARRAEEAV